MEVDDRPQTSPHAGVQSDNLTQHLAGLVCDSRLADIPEVVKHEGARALLNWIGCAIGGSSDATTNSAIATLQEFSGPPVATVLGRAERLDALSAAFVNGVSSAVHAFDDTHLPTVTHPTGPVAAALLALAETRFTSGCDLLHALVLGMEVECRLSNVLITPPAEGDERWLMTGLTGTIGAAVAAGRAMRLPSAEMVWAVGTAVQQVSGLREGHATMGHSFPIGHAARCGLFAALLAQRGFTGAQQAIEGPRGFAKMYAPRPCLEALTDGWGQTYEMLQNAFKPYPCGIVAHAAIDAALEVKRSCTLDVHSIHHVQLDVHPLAIALTGRPAPTNSFEVPYSMHHWVASALLFGAPDLRHRTDEAIRDPEVGRLRALVEARAKHGCARDEAFICVTMRDGTELRAHVPHARGSVERPLTDAELETKFRSQSEPIVGAEASQRLIDACWGLEHLQDGAVVPHAAALRVK